MEKFTGVRTVDENYVLDLQTKKELNGTLITSVAVGKGNKKKKEAELISNFFKADGENLSVIAKSGNRDITTENKKNRQDNIAVNFLKKFGETVHINGNIMYNNAIECMENGEIVIMSGGTGNPFFNTDTGSSLRGIEIEADVMLKGTRVDGIYTADPEKDPTATKFSDITYDEVLKRGLKVMDLTATCMCKENNLPIVVFDMDTVGNLKKVISGEEIGTVVHN